MSEIVYIGKFKKSSTSTEAAIVLQLRRLGHSVTCVDYPTENVKEHATKGYDLAIFSKCETVSEDVIKSFTCKTAMWIFDSLNTTTMDELRPGAEDIIAKGKLMDRIFTAAPVDMLTYRKMGCTNACLMMQACDGEMFYDYGYVRDFDITFIGNNYGSHRIEIIKQLHDYYGERFKLFSRTDTWGVPVEAALSGQEVAHVLARSKITINMSEIQDDDKWSRRLWDAMGCGAVVAAQYCPSFARFFTTSELATWKTVPDLFVRIDRLLSNEALLKSMSEAAMQRIVQRHTYKQRVAELLNEMDMEA